MSGWSCGPCDFRVEVYDPNKVLTHLESKTHKKYQHRCPRGDKGVLVNLSQCFDRDGIRHGQKCKKCKTEFAVYAHGIHPLSIEDYEKEVPQYLKDEANSAYHKGVTSRGYVKLDDILVTAKRHPKMTATGILRTMGLI